MKISVLIPVYNDERRLLYSELASLMGTAINGLLLLSGDDHINEIYHVDLGAGRMAPEFVASPFTLNTDLKEPNEIEGDRVASFSSKFAGGSEDFPP